MAGGAAHRAAGGLRRSGGGSLFKLSEQLSAGYRAQRDQLTLRYRGALTQSVRALDFRGIRFNAAQLALLDQQDPAPRQLSAKGELLRLVFARPELLRRPEGLGELMEQLQAVAAALPAGDPDLLVSQAYVLWQVGRSREQEWAAALLCAQALENAGAPASPEEDLFVLRPLAKHYLRAFLAQPWPAAWVPPSIDGVSRAPEQLARLLPEAQADGEVPGLEPLFAYDRAAQALERAATPGYLRMLQAHARQRQARARHDEAGAASAARERTQAAQAVLAAWAQFDTELGSDAWLATPATQLAAFALDDSAHATAAWFAQNPGADELPPEGRAARLAPPRVAWAARAARLLGPSLGYVLAAEAGRRYQALARQTRIFEQAYLAFLTEPAGAARAQHGRAAIEAAAKLGLADEREGHRVLLGESIQQALAAEGATLSAEQARQLLAGYRERHLRLL